MPRHLRMFSFCTTSFFFRAVFLRHEFFGLPLLILAILVFSFLLNGHNPQDVATSLGGVDLIGTWQRNLDAGTHFNYRRWQIGISDVESPGYLLGV